MIELEKRESSATGADGRVWSNVVSGTGRATADCPKTRFKNSNMITYRLLLFLWFRLDGMPFPQH
jgi:hypothetical protein